MLSSFSWVCRPLVSLRGEMSVQVNLLSRSLIALAELYEFFACSECHALIRSAAGWELEFDGAVTH